MSSEIDPATLALLACQAYVSGPGDDLAGRSEAFARAGNAPFDLRVRMMSVNTFQSVEVGLDVSCVQVQMFHVCKPACRPVFGLQSV